MRRAFNIVGQVVCHIIIGLALVAFLGATHQAIMIALGQ